jgi:hypothetical protein
MEDLPPLHDRIAAGRNAHGVSIWKLSGHGGGPPTRTILDDARAARPRRRRRRSERVRSETGRLRLERPLPLGGSRFPVRSRKITWRMAWSQPVDLERGRCWVRTNVALARRFSRPQPNSPPTRTNSATSEPVGWNRDQTTALSQCPPTLAGHPRAEITQRTRRSRPVWHCDSVLDSGVARCRRCGGRGR